MNKKTAGIGLGLPYLLPELSDSIVNSTLVVKAIVFAPSDGGYGGVV